MQEKPAAGPGERMARITLFVLAGLMLAGLVAWLDRIYGFEPLKIREPGERGSKP